MNKKTIKIAIVGCAFTLLLGALFSQLVLIVNLSEQVTSLKEQISVLKQNESSIHNSPTTVIPNQEYLFAELTEDYNNINTKTHTIDYKLKLLPKTITDDTNITLTIGEDVYPMDRNGDFFEVIIPFSLFSNDKEENALIQVETNGEKKSQKHNIITKYLDQYCLPTLSSSGTSSFTKGPNNITIHYSLDIVAGKEESMLHLMDISDFNHIDMVSEVNGKIIERVDKTEELKKAHRSDPVIGFDFNGKKTFENVNEEDIIHMYLEAKDEYGYIHRQTIQYVSPHSDDAYKYEYYQSICDKEGNVLNNREIY